MVETQDESEAADDEPCRGSDEAKRSTDLVDVSSHHSFHPLFEIPSYR